MTKYVVLFSLETGEYLIHSHLTTKDWEEANRFNSEENALAYLSVMKEPKLKYWCTRTFYKLT
jgi:hypothetical protein